MPDITMCFGRKCPKKGTCYRYLATPNYYQSYSDFEEVCCKDGSYREYWKARKKVTYEPASEEKES